MIEYLNTILIGQFEAALCMLSECIQKCPQDHWEGKIANDSFRQVAYHTLFFVDLYSGLSRDAMLPRILANSATNAFAAESLTPI
jgi:hypothetical protein